MQTIYMQIKRKNAVSDLVVHFYIFIRTQKEITSTIDLYLVILSSKAYVFEDKTTKN